MKHSVIKYTIETRLDEKQNKDLIQYFDSIVGQYNKVFRIVWQMVKKNPKLAKESGFVTQLQNEFNICKRTANSIVRIVVGRFNSTKSRNELELQAMQYRILSMRKKIDALQIKLNNKKKLASENKIINNESYRKLKLYIVSMKFKIDRLVNEMSTLSNQISTNNLKVTFGTKYLFRTNINKFLSKRDNQIISVGDKYDSCCNRNFQLYYNYKNNQFVIRVRKDFYENKQLKGDSRFVYGQCYFNHLKKELINILKTKNSPLTYTIIKRNNKYFLQCTMEIKKESITRKNYGVIGIDFNKGFLAVSETNECGSLIYTDRLNYRFKQGTKTENDLLQCINILVKKSLSVGKDLVIEDLNFSKKKSKMLKATSSKGKKYNDMLHSLAYRKFSDRCEQICNRCSVGLIKVNPAWTSWIANKKYCDLMKLNIHTGASYVIARRGMGYREKKIK